jgi:hypothetical protein
VTELRAQVDAGRIGDALKTARLGAVARLRCESASKNDARGTWRHFRSIGEGIDENETTTDTNHGLGRSRRLCSLKGYSESE